MDWNEFPLAAMYHVTEADRVFSMPVDRWGAKEDAFFSAMLDGLTAAGFDY
jgi:hypothetical protein